MIDNGHSLSVTGTGLALTTFAAGTFGAITIAEDIITTVVDNEA